MKRGGETLEKVKVWKGETSELNVGIVEDLIVSVPRGTGKNLKASLLIDPMLEAPITKGQTVGSLKVMQDDQVVREVPLVAQNAVERGGLFKRLWDSIVLFFTGLFS